MRRLACLLPVALLAGAALGQDRIDTVIRRLDRVTTPSHDNAHVRTMFSLRQMRDPSLEPLFRHLATRDDWQIQVHAVLGLAEIDADGRLDVDLVRNIRVPGQEHLVSIALEEGFLTPPLMERLVADAAIRPLPRLLLVAELMRVGEMVPSEMLETLSVDRDLRVAGLAACLRGRDIGQSALSSYRDRLAAMGRRERATHLTWLFDVLREHHITGGLPLVRDALSARSPRRDVVTAGLHTLLTLDTPSGVETWRRLLGPSPGHARRVRFGMLLLDSDAPIDAGTYDALKGDPEPLVDAIVRTGQAMARGADPTPHMIGLLEIGHVASTEWVMRRAQHMPPARSRSVYEHLLDNLLGELGPPTDRVTLGIRAVERLFAIDPQLVLQRIAAVEDDSLLQQVMLLGLFETTDAAAGAAASRVPRSGPGRADSIALVLLARHVESLDPEDQEQLGVIAGGGGRVSEMLQTQAAWLYLRHTGTMRSALDRLCAVVE